MVKKQILKMKHSKKLVSIGLLGLMLLGSMNTFAGNIADTYYQINCGPEGFNTVPRQKQDYTSAYIYHEGVDSAKVSVYSGGVNYSVNGLYYPVAAGTEGRIPNYVKERGKDNCYLHIEPLSGKSSSMSGRWSPDSI